jgi:hypothetical protein
MATNEHYAAGESYEAHVVLKVKRDVSLDNPQAAANMVEGMLRMVLCNPEFPISFVKVDHVSIPGMADSVEAGMRERPVTNPSPEWQRGFNEWNKRICNAEQPLILAQWLLHGHGAGVDVNDYQQGMRAALEGVLRAAAIGGEDIP